MKTTKTSEVIAKRMRKRGYDTQELTRWPDGTFAVRVWGRFGVLKEVDEYDGDGKTLTAAFLEVERQWEKEQADE